MVMQARRVIEIEVIADDALRKLGGIERAAERSEKSLSLLERQVRSLGTAFRGLIGFLGVQEFIGLADAAQDIEARLASVSGSVEQGRESFEDLLAIALRLGVGIEGLAAAYTRLGVAVPSASQEELIQTLDTLSTVLTTTGATTQQVNAVLLQFSQALGSGALQGDEFRSIAENAPVLLRAWREAIGEADTAFRELSASAALSTETWFENLDAIQTNTLAMIGMSEPPLTVARALENLRTQMVALIGDSEGISLVFAAIAQAIQLVAENLDTLINVALAFGALRLTQLFADVAKSSTAAAAGMIETATATGAVGKAATDASRGVREELTAANIQHAAFLAATDLWSDYVDRVLDTEKSLGSTNTALRGLTVLLDTTVGRFVAWVAVIEAASFAFERLNDAIEQQDRFVESARRSAEATRDLTEEVIAARDALTSVDTQAPAELTAGFQAFEQALGNVDDRLQEIARELDELGADRGGGVLLGLAQQEVDRIRSLRQEQETLTRLVEISTPVYFDYADAVFDAERRTSALGLSLVQTREQMKTATETAERLSREEMSLRFRLEIADAATPAERIEIEVRQSFDRVTEAARASIDRVAAQLRALQQLRQSAQLTPEEIADLDREFARLNRTIDTNAAVIAANEQARQEQTAGLIAQRQALAEAEQAERAMAEARRLTRDEFDRSIPVQFALQELFERGEITSNQLAEALAKLAARYGDVAEKAEEQRDVQQDLRASNVELAAEVDNARLRLEAFVAGGEDVLKAQEAQIRVSEAVAEAYRTLGKTAADELTPEQAKLVERTRGLTAELERLAATQETVERVRALGASLLETQRAAQIAEDALAAYRRGGASELDQFEERLQLQEAFNDALREQNTTFERASPGQLRYAQDITDALRRQLSAQEELNRAKEAEADIDRFRAQLAEIGAPAEGPVEFRDVEETIRRARRASGQAEAAALLEAARAQTERFAETVERPFDEALLEELKRDLERAAEFVFEPPAVEDLDFDPLEQALAQQEFTARFGFDPVSVQAALDDVQAIASRTPIRVPIVPAGGAVPTAASGASPAPIPFGTGVGIPPGSDLSHALTGAADAVGGV